MLLLFRCLKKQLSVDVAIGTVPFLLWIFFLHGSDRLTNVKSIFVSSCLPAISKSLLP